MQSINTKKRYRLSVQLTLDHEQYFRLHPEYNRAETIRVALDRFMEAHP